MSSEVVEQLYAEKIKLMGKRVIVERIIKTEEGGILLPEDMRRPNLHDWLTVVNVGEDCEEGLKKGDQVFVAPGYSEFCKHEKRKFYITEEAKIMCVKTDA